MREIPCVVSAAEHAGWAHTICVAASGNVPAVLERRRVALIDPGLPTMPYHHESLAMEEDEADALIARVASVCRGPHLGRIADHRDRAGAYAHGCRPRDS